VLGSVLVAYLAFEFKVRYDIAQHYLQGRFSPVVYSEPFDNEKWDAVGGKYLNLFNVRTSEELQRPGLNLGHFNRNRDITLWFFDPDQNLKKEVNFHINNMGFLSRKDYAIARKGPEYRIAIIGDSVTGSTTMDHPWVDRVEDLLNAERELVRQIGKPFKVFNIGHPGGGFPHFELNYRVQAKPFEPDLVIVNYIESDFPRRLQPLKRPGAEPIGGTVEYRVGPDDSEVAKLMVMCEGPPVNLTNGTCRQFFGFYMPGSLATDRARVQKLKTTIAHDYIGKQLWTSFYPYGAMKVLGYPVTLDNYRNPEVFHMDIMDETEMVDQAGRHLHEILADHPNVLFTLHPLYSDIFPKRDDYKRTSLLVERNPDIKVVIMRDRLPIDRGEQEVYRWYNLPVDGHMSDYGGEIYAEAMASLIRERLLQAQKESGRHS